MKRSAPRRTRRATGPTSEQRTALYARSGGRCERCGTPLTGPASVHHRRPRGMGGTNDPTVNSPANLLVLCGSGTTGCHGWVETNRADARDLGLLVSQYADPAAEPYIDSLGRSWILTPDYRRTSNPSRVSATGDAHLTGTETL